MQTYDILMLIVLLAATVFGMWKGMAWQIASLASLVLSYFVALKFADQIAPSLSGVAPPPLNKFVAMLIIYMATSFVIWTLFRLVSGIIDRVKLEYFDRQMGAIFGFAKGVLLCVAITFFAVSLLPQAQKEAIIGSQTGHYIVVMLNKTESVVPPEIHQVLRPYLDRIGEQLDPKNQSSEDQQFQSPWKSELPFTWPSTPSAESESEAPDSEVALPSTTTPKTQTADRPGSAPY